MLNLMRSLYNPSQLKVLEYAYDPKNHIKSSWPSTNPNKVTTVTILALRYLMQKFFTE